MSYSEIWNTLSAIDVSAHVEKKQNLSYLSWAWAWGVLMSKYPQATYEFHPVAIEGDGSATVSVTVTIDECSRSMWLPVMDHRNNAIVKPDSRKISDSKMRCLVKCLAMFGLGHYIYAGEDVPDKEQEEKQESIKVEVQYQATVDKHLDSLVAIRDALAIEDYSTAKEAWRELDQDVQVALWKAPSKGGWFTTKERSQMQSNEWSAAQ
jgi:hypothetical protein